MHAYGPVPSRRLGRSIGASPIPPKTCTYSCVYCQLGRTTRMLARRQAFFPKEEIMADIATVARGCQDADYITFAGDGEPTLCSDLGWLLGECKARWPTKTAVITNGSLLWSPDVRADLGKADVVLSTLACGSPETFKKLHRPHPQITFDRVLEGALAFRREQESAFWAEVMLVEGVNHSRRELELTAGALEQAGPDKVFIMVPTRPPAEGWVKPPGAEALVMASEILGRSLDVEMVIGTEAGDFGGAPGDAGSVILETCSRHPLRLEQARQMETDLGGEAVDRLLENGKLVMVEYGGKTYLLPAHIRPGRQGEERDKKVTR